ncbi:MAG: VWA domain-containing protein [Pyrinomonadaceae bacterium]
MAICYDLRAQDDDDVIRVDSSLVVLNVTITDSEGRPVSGLQRNRFSVFEDGKEQSIEFFSSDETPFAAVILLDTSGSMEERVSMARAAAIRFLSGLRENDMTAIYRFDSKIELVHQFSEMRDMDERVFEVKAYGMTALNDAIIKASVELSKRPEKRKAIIVLSDGQDNFSGKSADRALRSALAADASIYTVDMSDPGASKRLQNVSVLKNFAERTGGRFVSSPGGSQMREAFEQIVAELGNQYTLGYQPKNSVQDGKWRAIALRVARKNLIIRTRKGYNAPKASK